MKTEPTYSEKLIEMSGRRVLIVDDNPDSLTFLAHYLRDHGLEVACVQDWVGVQNELLRRPDIILLDVMMPWVDGFEACRRLKAQADSRDIPVIFITGTRLSEVDKVCGFRVGAIDFMSKPLMPAEVLARIQIRLQTVDEQTDLLRANRQLYQREQRRAQAEVTLQQTLDQAVVIVSPKKELLFCSRKADELLRGTFPDYAPPHLPSALFTHSRAGSLVIERRNAPNQAGSMLITLAVVEQEASPESLEVLGLTTREAEILYWIAQGKTSQEIGIILQVSPHTVKKHVQHILPKLNVESRLAAALYAKELLSLRKAGETEGEGGAATMRPQFAPSVTDRAS